MGDSDRVIIITAGRVCYKSDRSDNAYPTTPTIKTPTEMNEKYFMLAIAGYHQHSPKDSSIGGWLFLILG